MGVKVVLRIAPTYYKLQINHLFCCYVTKKAPKPLFLLLKLLVAGRCPPITGLQAHLTSLILKVCRSQ
jgi:hypothetical protein